MSPLPLLLALTLGGGSLGPAAVTRVAITNPAALPRLLALLAWAGRALPSVRPERVEAALAPLAIAPFDPAGWRAAGLDPRGAVWLAPGRMALGVADPARLLAHLGAAQVATATLAEGLGLAAGRPDVVGVLRGDRLWLTPYRALIDEPPARLPRLARRRGADLADRLRGFRPPRAPRPRSPGLPRRPPDVRAEGTGPAPALGWSGALWAEPERTIGWAHVSLSDLATPWAAQLGRAPPPRLLPVRQDLAIEARVQVRPGALAEGFAGLTADDGVLLTGAAPAALTPGGTLVVAVALRPGAPKARVDAALARLAAAQPGLQLARRAAPDRVVAWFEGEAPAGDRAWLEGDPAGRGDAPATLRVRPPAVLAALAARDGGAAGPRLGTATRVALRLTYGALLAREGDLALRAWKPQQGLDLVVDLGGSPGPSRPARNSDVDPGPRPHQ